jgi:hypothetical protein
VEWELAVAAASVHKSGIAVEKLADADDHSEPGCSVDVDGSAASDGVRGQFSACRI